MDCEVLQCFMELGIGAGTGQKRKSAQWVRIFFFPNGLYDRFSTETQNSK